VLVVATDGLFKNAQSEAISAACADADVTAIANTLVEQAKLRSGTYPDDVAVVVVVPK
jgi:serine/threonine protein phosphatase PrpC